VERCANDQDVAASPESLLQRRGEWDQKNVLIGGDKYTECLKKETISGQGQLQLTKQTKTHHQKEGGGRLLGRKKKTIFDGSPPTGLRKKKIPLIWSILRKLT